MIVVGLGTQGKKRKLSAGEDFVASVDPFNGLADYKSVEEVPLESFDGAFLCTPDNEKPRLINYLASNEKHILCEKPLKFNHAEEFDRFEELCRSKSIFYSTAYNHRFEPSFVRMKELIQMGILGQIYSISLFYGNGTAKEVQSSPWRDQGDGVLSDLGSHLIDTLEFWLPNTNKTYQICRLNRFESNSFDYARIQSVSEFPTIALEMTTCMWKNSFECRLIAEFGSAHILGLCKWGPASLVIRKRVFPSGVPTEEQFLFPPGDPTWNAEYASFKDRVSKGHLTDLTLDKFIFSEITRINKEMKTS